MVDWKTTGPQVLGWMRVELPRRRTMIGVYAECSNSLPGLGLDEDRLRNWLVRGAPEWPAIKRTLGTSVLTGASASAPPVPGGLTILEYDRQREVAEDRARCPVCKLPPAPREEIAEAKRAGLNATRILRSLAHVHNITITPHDWAHHINARHET
jgi:hypothetical protein